MGLGIVPLMTTRSKGLPVSRRQFLGTFVATLTTVAVTGPNLLAARPTWTVGCFNRPWSKFSYDEALDGIRDAGYKTTGFLLGQKGDVLTNPPATQEYLENLKKRIAARGLQVNMTALRFKELSNRHPAIALELSLAMGGVLAKRFYNRPKRVAVT